MKVRCVMNTFGMARVASEVAEITGSRERYAVLFDGKKFTDYQEFKVWLKENYFAAIQIIEFKLTEEHRCGNSWVFEVPFDSGFRSHCVSIVRV